MKKIIYLLLALSVITAACNLEKVDDGNDSCANPPAAAFTTSVSEGPVPLSVTFTNTSVNATEYTWNFRNGSTSTDASPTHIFGTAGTYQVMLIATNNNGCRDTAFTTIIAGGSAGNAPVARFTVTGGDCVAPCSASFSNSSTNGVSYAWNFGDGNTSNEINPSHTYTTGGNFTVLLTATNAAGITDDTTVVVHIRKGFKKVLDLGAAPVQLASGNQLSDGNYHIMYYENGYKSLYLDKNGENHSNITPFAFDDNWFFINGIPSNNGGFILSGSNGSTGKAVVAEISSAQGILWQQEFNFANNSNSSTGNNLVQLGNNETVVCGAAISPGNTAPGFARISSVGNILNNVEVLDVQTQYLSGFSIARKDDGNLIMTCDGVGVVSGSAYLMNITQNGALQSLSNYPGISSLRGIKAIGNNRFLLKSEGQGQYFLDMIDQSGMLLTYLQNNDTNIIEYDVASDGNIIILRKEDGIRLTKVSAADMGVVLWDKKFTETGGTLEPRRLLKCADGSYLVSGTFIHNGQTDLYFLKTDVNGDWE